MAVSLEGRAADDLRYIRKAMERSGTFTAVPGRGGAAMGAIGLIASLVAAQQSSAERWLTVWLVAAVLGLTIGVLAIRAKAARAGVPLTGAVGRRFAMSVFAPLAAGAALSAGLTNAGNWAMLPPVWLLLYGTGLVTGGAVSAPIVFVMGLCFMALGMLALVTPEWGNVWLGLGFGALQILFGLRIARKHGG